MAKARHVAFRGWVTICTSASSLAGKSRIGATARQMELAQELPWHRVTVMKEHARDVLTNESIKKE